MNTKKVALVLSGCGVFDGSEIHESVITLNVLEELGAQVSFFAPNIEQMHTVSHLGGAQASANRNVLEESARIARGNICALDEFSAKDFDALVFVGGFGAAKNLSSFAIDGENCSVNEDVARSINEMQSLNKPSVFICIAPVIAARVIANGVKVTIGTDAVVAEKINAMGGEHVECSADSYVFDEKFNVYSTPAYMLAQNTPDLRAGIKGAILHLMLRFEKR